jgi:hypothetical protein
LHGERVAAEAEIVEAGVGAGHFVEMDEGIGEASVAEGEGGGALEQVEIDGGLAAGGEDGNDQAVYFGEAGRPAAERVSTVGLAAARGAWTRERTPTANRRTQGLRKSPA